MPKAKKKRGEAPMPMGGAGLIRFFQDETEGIKMGPVTVTLLAIGLISIVIIAWARSLGLLPFF
ncbi:MAG: preprotein translocase subunit Sec61beta [Candidatus Asgardarchaeia archaeon]